MDMEERIWDPESELYKSRHRYFELLYRASFLADNELQAHIDSASELAENAGHRPYDNGKEKHEFQAELLREGFAIARAIEDAARQELGLPPRHRGPANDEPQTKPS